MSSAGANTRFPFGRAQSQNLVFWFLSYYFKKPKQGFGGRCKIAISSGLST